MSQLGCGGSGNKVQKEKKGPGSLGEGRAKVALLGGRGGEGQEMVSVPVSIHSLSVLPA